MPKKLLCVLIGIQKALSPHRAIVTRTTYTALVHPAKAVATPR